MRSEAAEARRRAPGRVVDIEDLPPAGLYPRVVKPCCDRLFALFVLLLIWPLFLLLAVLVSVDSRGGAFFVQERVGRMGQPFRLFKFRSMVAGAAVMGAGALVERSDSRVTRVGRILRATSLDELPQLLNILLGEMSLVGPRPTLEYQVLRYDEFQKRRLLVKPGVTGLAQIRGRKSLDWPARIRADVEYVESISAASDLRICLLTPWTLIRGEGQAKGDYWKDRAALSRDDAGTQRVDAQSPREEAESPRVDAQSPGEEARSFRDEARLPRDDREVG